MNKVTRVMLVSAVTNICLSILKVIAGLILKSSALFADGIHSFSDLITDFFAVIGNILSRKPADLKHPYGHGKIEYLTSIGISLVVIFLGCSIISGSVNKEIFEMSFMVSVVSLITIISKYLLSYYILKKGKEYSNNILIASGKESRADVISSLVVFISAILGLFADYIGLFKYADIIASIIVGILIIKTGFLILKENISIILGEQEIDSDVHNKIRKIILKNKNIKTIDELIILKFGHAYKLTIEVSMDSSLTLLEAHDIVDQVEKELKNIEKVEYVNIHINPYKEPKKFSLKTATNNDLEIILEALNKKINLKNIEEYAKENLKNTKIITQDNKQIGIIIYYKEKDYYLFDTIYLKEEYRNKGIGYKIISDFINKDKIIKIWISKKNIKMINLYQNLGFEIIDENRKKYLMEVR